MDPSHEPRDLEEPIGQGFEGNLCLLLKEQSFRNSLQARLSGDSLARYLYLIGTAGSGKSTMSYAFQIWMQNQGLDAITVNLDPGAENLMYDPDVDIRDWIKLREIMMEHGLGPNGAQILCADMLALRAREVAEVIDSFKTNYVLVDTPGQMELFTFRESSKVVIETLGKEDSFLVFLSDPILSRTPSGLVSMMMLCATTQFRFSVPFLNVLSKSDLLSEMDLESILKWSSDPHSLYNALLDEGMTLQTTLNLEFFKGMESMGVYRELTPVSSETMYGFEDVYNAVQQFFEGGEDLLKD